MMGMVVTRRTIFRAILLRGLIGLLAAASTLALAGPTLAASANSPTIASVTPNHGPPSGGTKVTITGTNLIGATAVKFGSSEATSFKVESETEITAISPAFTGGEDDAMPVFVTTPDGTNEYECGEEQVGYIYEPTVASVGPHSGPSTGGTEVTIRGTAFEGILWGKGPLCTLARPVVQWVSFGSTPAKSVNIVSESEITAIAPPGTGTVDVTIKDAHPLGSSPITLSDRFRYGYTPPPAIESESVAGITEHGATLEATINPEGQAVRYQFQVATNPTEYPPEIICPPEQDWTPLDGCIGSTPTTNALPIGLIGNGSEYHSATLDLAGAGMVLQPNTTYYYRIIAARSVQSEDTIEWEGPPVYGPSQTFTTSGLQSSTGAGKGSEIVGELTGQPEVLPKLPAGNPAPKRLTRAQKLTKALKQCKEDKSKRTRATCEKRAHKRYGPKQKGPSGPNGNPRRG